MSNISLEKEKKNVARGPERVLAQQADHLHVAVPYIRDGRRPMRRPQCSRVHSLLPNGSSYTALGLISTSREF